MTGFADTQIIDRRKLFEQVAAEIERQIISGALRPGDRLPPERDLQERFGVGRPAIREALIALQRAGLVEVSNGTRARVAAPTAMGVLRGMAPAVRQILSTSEGQRHLHEVRVFFEAGLARDAARKATDEQLETLHAALERNLQSLGDTNAFIATDVAFHFALAEISGNPIIVGIHDTMSGWLRQQRVLTAHNPSNARSACQAHGRIFDAVAARDPQRAEDEMRTHLEQVGDMLLRQSAPAGD